jgi:hypothetical protein
VRRWLRPIGLGWLALMTLGAATADPPAEYQVKAAFLANFVKFVDWPPAALPAGDDTLTVAIVGNKYGEIVEQALTGKAVKDRHLVVRRYDDARKIGTCHVLYVMADTPSALRAALGAVAGKPVLTISEVENVEVSEAVVNFVLVETRLGFAVNLDAADAGGLQVSSKLLTLARKVRRNRVP